MSFRSGDGRASISIAFYPQGAPEWKSPVAYREYMREQGSLGDSHVPYAVEISSRAGSRVQFTTYRYSREYLLGAKFDVLYTDLLMIPDPDGIYVLRCDAEKERFPQALGAFESFLRSVVLGTPAKG